MPILNIEIDGTQVPIVHRELEGRAGRVEGQPARTCEVKLGCTFTQTTTDEEGRPVRDEASTTYVGAIETAEAFGPRIYTEAWERGWSRAEKKVMIGDGAEWIWNIADRHFPGAIQIVDLYHARQHLWELSRILQPNQEIEQKRWMLRHQPLLDSGQIEKLARALRSIDTANSELAEKIRLEADYFERNTLRMRYPEFRQQGLFVGSGVIEAGCKNRNRCSTQAVRHVLDRRWSELHHRFTLQPAQRQVRRLLGFPLTRRLSALHLCRAPGRWTNPVSYAHAAPLVRLF